MHKYFQNLISSVISCINIVGAEASYLGQGQKASTTSSRVPWLRIEAFCRSPFVALGLGPEGLNSKPEQQLSTVACQVSILSHRSVFLFQNDDG